MSETPVYKTPSHVDNYDYGNEGDKEEHYSCVFHMDHPVRIVAVFYGPNHREDSEAYCLWKNKQQMIIQSERNSGGW